jgi:hypothetical protein
MEPDYKALVESYRRAPAEDSAEIARLEREVLALTTKLAARDATREAQLAEAAARFYHDVRFHFGGDYYD